MMQLTKTLDVERWLGALASWRQGQPLRDPGFIKPFHLVTLALTAKRHRSLRDGELRLPSDLEAYAARMALWEAAGLTAPLRVGKKDATGKFLPAEPLEDKAQIANVTEKLVKIAPASDEDTRDSLSYVIDELVQNCFYHSAPEAELFGIACAQAWPNGKLAQIAIADPGVGIRETLGQNPEYLDELRTANACEFATRYSVSGKLGRGHAGYGLTLARETLENNRGNLVLVSYEEAVACRKAGAYSEEVSPAWPGTLLVIEWRLDQPLDVRSVYESWPTPEGYSDDDFDF